MERFAELGAKVSYHDPYVPEIWATREHKRWKGKKSLHWSEKNLRAQDAVVAATKHEIVNYKQLACWARLIIDTRNAMSGICGPAKVIKA